MRHLTPSRLVFAIVFLSLVLVAFCETRSLHHDFVLGRASRDMEVQIKASLAKRANFPLFSLVDGDPDQAATVCIVTPYQSAKELLPGTDLGMDSSWLNYVDEGHIGFIALDRAGKVTKVAQLRRLTIDIRPYSSGRCYQREDSPTVSRAPEDVSAFAELVITVHLQ